MGKNHIKIREEEGQKYIVLSEAFGSRDKILNFIYFVFISSLLFVFLYFIFPEISSISGGIVAFLGFGFYFLMAYRFINKALKTEYLIVDGNELTVFKGGFLNKSQRTFDIDEITFLGIWTNPFVKNIHWRESRLTIWALKRYRNWPMNCMVTTVLHLNMKEKLLLLERIYIVGILKK